MKADNQVVFFDRYIFNSYLSTLWAKNLQLMALIHAQRVKHFCGDLKGWNIGSQPVFQGWWDVGKVVLSQGSTREKG